MSLYTKNNTQLYYTYEDIQGRRPGTDLKARIEGIEWFLESDYMKKDYSVLDVGCAEGLILHEFAKKCTGRSCGIDIQQSSIDAAQEKFPTYEFHQIDLNTDNLIKHEFYTKYNIILCLGVLHHLDSYNSVLDKIVPLCKDIFIYRGKFNLTNKSMKKYGFEKFKTNFCNKGNNTSPVSFFKRMV